MVYTDDPTVGKTTEFVDTDEAERRLLSLTDDEVEELARHALTIEEHYGRPMDIEWGKDGLDGELYVLQARPETVMSRAGVRQRFRMDEKGEVVVEGRAIGQKIGAGAVRVMTSIEEMHEFNEGEVLVADMTDPDWEPIMKRASAIVTNRGGRTCHAAIIARELGIPAVVGTGTATRALEDGRAVTVSCAEGDTGYIYDGVLDFTVEETELSEMPEIGTKIMMNVGTPEQAFAFAQLPNAGVGLARLEFIINRQIGIHPKALLELDDLEEPLKSEITETIAAYPGPREFFVQRVAEGVSTLAAAFAPEPVIVRMSDFKSNEYANMVGGELYEPDEENPMIGYRGASRYLSEEFADCFAMEAEALKFVRDEMGLTNVKIMIPFVRTIAEAKGVIDLLGRARPGPRRERPAGRHDVRGALQRHPRRRVPRALRRLLDRVQRHDPARPRPRPRLLARRRRPSTSATRPCCSCSSARSRRAARPASTSASAARAPATTPTWPSGCSSRASSRCPSTPTRSSTPGCDWARLPPRPSPVVEERAKRASRNHETTSPRRRHMTQLDERAATPALDAEALRDTLRTTFAEGRTRPLAWRQEQLTALRRMLVEREDDFVAALAQDLGRPPAESWAADLRSTIREIEDIQHHLDDWTAPERRKLPLLFRPGKAQIIREPVGVVLIIAPWNYPVQLLVTPLAAALAAGNAVVCKPSEVAPATSAALARLLPEYLDPAAVAVVEGGIPETTDAAGAAVGPHPLHRQRHRRAASSRRPRPST